MLSFRKTTSCFFGLLLAALITGTTTISLLASHTEGWNDLLLGVGVKLFPSFLAADQDIVFKNEAEGTLLLLVVHSGQREVAEQAAQYLRTVKTVRDVPVRVLVVAIQELADLAPRKIAGILLAEPIHQDLETLIHFSREHKAILFSPFKGDVERGILGGLLVTDKVVPMVNLQAMEAAGIRIKPFFLKVARTP